MIDFRKRGQPNNSFRNGGKVMRFNKGRTSMLAALVLIIGGIIIYQLFASQGSKEAANENSAANGGEQVKEEQAVNEALATNEVEEEPQVEYVFQAHDPRNTLDGPNTNIADCAKCSEGKQVGGIHGGGFVQFNHVEVPEAGKYIVTVDYVTGDSRPFHVKVNDKEAEKFELPEVAKGDWESVGSYDFEVELDAGNNVLKFSDENWYSPNLDRIVIKQAPASSDKTQNAAFAWGDSGSIGEVTSTSNYGAIKVSQHEGGLTIDSGVYQIVYNTKTGLSAYSWDGSMIAKGIYSSFKYNDQIINSSEYDTHRLLAEQIEPIEDGHGKGIKLIVRNEKQEMPVLDQIYYVYEDSTYFIKAEEVTGSGELSTNYMAPVVLETAGGLDLGQYEDNRVLIVPFDNDAWSRHTSKSMNTHLNTKNYISSEVTAIFDNASRNGLIVGSVTHDTWKTGIEWSGSDNRLNELKVYGGFTSRQVTYDRMEHGAISGTTLKSPQIFIGHYSDYRDGMEAYGRANAVVAPPLSFGPNIPQGVPVGWNSWAAYAEHLSYEKMVDVSNFFHDHLQNASFNNDGVVYINMDSFWTNLSDEQLIDLTATIRKNGQKAGSYHTPFVYWGKNMLIEVDGTDGKYTYGDIALKDSEGRLVPHNMGIILDPTHPGTKMKMDFDIARFKSRGYEFLKLDFLTHASMEGEFYDKNITTGVQAYNEGMSYLIEQLDDTMFVSASIAPIFPSQYAHSRRISCDIFETIDSTEYQLNNQTYGWWQNGTIYHYTDPDYSVLGKNETFEGARTRVNATVISGTVYFNSDDVNDKESQKRMKELMTNPRVNELATKGKAFRSVEGNTGNNSSDTFVLEDEGVYYLAVFNFSTEPAEKTVDLARAGIPADVSIVDLWTGESVQSKDGKLTLSLTARQSVLYQITP
ncbi:carbohydrate-binding protein [Paenibacillaceae bacterium]|nr:carbohydrate-binding protein [Paenibacillaceae bacterium]